MKHLYLLIFIVLSLGSEAQDLVSHGPDNVYYAWKVVEGKNKRLFLCGTGGLYYSDDRGDSWQLIQHPFNNIYLEPRLATDPVTGNLCTYGNGAAYVSPDNGNTWNPIYVAMPDNFAFIKTIAYVGDTVWLGGLSGLLYFPPGNTFRQPVLVSKFQGQHITAMRVDGRTVIVGTERQGLFKSIDGGATWNTLNNGLPANYHVFGFNLHHGRWFVYGMEGTFESGDEGVSWHPVTNGLTTGQLNDLQFVGDVIYASSYSYENVWRLPAGSDTWELIDDALPSERGTMEFIWADEQDIIVGGWRGLYKRSVAAGPFEPSYKGVTDAAVFHEIDRASDGTIWTMATHGGVYSKAPGESQFTAVQDELANYGSTPLMHDTLVVVRDYRLDFFDVITRQSKGNLTYLNVLFPRDFAKAWGGMYLSTIQNGIYRYNGSQTWEAFNEGLGSEVVNAFRYYKGLLWAATENGLFKRGVGDNAWIRVGVGDAETRSIRVLYTDGARMLISTNNGSFVSDDSGVTWKRIYALNTIYVDAFIIHDSRIHAATYNAVYISPADPATWTAMVDEYTWSKYQFNEGPISSMKAIDGRMYLATWERGIWSIPLPHMLRKLQNIVTFTPTEVVTGTEVTINATMESGLPAAYRLLSGPASLDGDKLTVLGEGYVVIEVYQGGNDVYQPVRQQLVLNAQNVTGIGDEPIEMTSVYPVPTDAILHVSHIPNAPTKATIVDMQGRVLMSANFNEFTQFDLSSLGQGVYVLVLELDNKRLLRRKVVKN